MIKWGQRREMWAGERSNGHWPELGTGWVSCYAVAIAIAVM